MVEICHTLLYVYSMHVGEVGYTYSSCKLELLKYIVWMCGVDSAVPQQQFLMPDLISNTAGSHPFICFKYFTQYIINGYVIHNTLSSMSKKKKKKKHTT